MEAGAEFAAFCRREYPRLVGALVFYCADSAVAQDLAQEALARAFQQWSRVRVMRSPGGWVHRVAVNLANSRFRRRRAELRAQNRQDPVRVDVGDDVAEAVDVRRAVARLPERQRTALTLRYVLDLPAADAAEVMGCSEAAVRQHTRRAVAALRPRFLPEPVSEVNSDG